MDRTGSRLVGLFQVLEKLTSAHDSATSTASSSRYSTEDVQQLRYLSSKILQYITSQTDKSHWDLVVKNVGYIDCLLGVLESCVDKSTSLNLIYIFAELILRLNSAKRLSVFVSHGATQVLLHVLVCESKDDDCSTEFLVAIHQLLSKLGPRDRKFGVKARLYQALGVTLGLIRNYLHSPKVLQSLVHVLKLYAADAVNASYLGKNGAVTYLFKILAICQRKHLVLLKYTLDTLGLLVRSKSNAARAVGLGGVSVLLNMFTDWHRADSKNRHIGLRKSLLNVLKNVTNLKSGRAALTEADGIRLLYSACQEAIDCRELESVIYLASIIMRKCFPKSRLPISSLRGPMSFPIPDSDIYGLSCETTDDGNEYESSLDNDDDVSSDDDPEARKIDSDDDADLSIMSDMSYKRSWDDLVAYKQFFTELFEFDPILEDTDPGFRQSNGPALLFPAMTLTVSQSNFAVTSASQNPQNNNNTMLRSCQSFGVLQGVDRLSVMTTQTLVASPCRRLSLGTLKVCTPPRLSTGLATTSALFCDGSAVGLRPPVTDTAELSPKTARRSLNVVTNGTAAAAASAAMITPGRSPRVRRKAPKTSRPKKSSSVKSKLPIQSKSSVEDWSKVDLNSVFTSLSSSTTTNGDLATATASDLKVDDASADEDAGPTVTSIAIEIEDCVSEKVDSPELYAELAAATKSVGHFTKLAYPDMYGHVVTPFKEGFYEKKFGTQRNRILQDIDRFINPEQTINRVVYCLDDIIGSQPAMSTCENSILTNDDEQRVRNREGSADGTLQFNSQFESGNLRKAIQVRKYEYDLILNPDVNTNHHHQWFYFEVSNMEAGVPYRFNIINCEKLNSQFNFGMRPVMFSVSEALQGRAYWYRVGTKICYYKNHFVRSAQTTGGMRGKTYYTATFTVTFKQERDVCYLAYHYPYTYTMLQYHLYQLEASYDSSNIYYRNQMLCETVGGNSVPLLTITAHPISYDREGIEQLKSRPYIFLTSRVHPGESNSSWVMKGTLELLMSDKPIARTLRDMFIFKIVPMLNPDGVINGTHRCSLVAEDLNRRWFRPCPKRHPTIYHTKGLMQYLQQAIGRGPLVYCDYHGHSRRKNVFLYGCSPGLSWIADDMDNPTQLCKGIEDPGYKLLPKLLHQSAPSFSLNSCSFVIEKYKETTARVVVWRQLGVVRSYTMESSYCGCDQGQYKGQHINTFHLEEMGCKFAESLVKIRARPMRPSAPSSSNLAAAAAAATNEVDEDLSSNLDLLRVPTDSGSSSAASNLSDVVSDGDQDLEAPDDDDLF